jgi:hypothetical protein
VRQDPQELILLEGMIVGGSQAILNQEARGAAAAREAKHIPKNRSGITDEQLKALGFDLTGEGDDLFDGAVFPEGWAIESDREDPRHMVFKDEKGRVRASMFYKAAFYDRYANCSFRTRYRIDKDYDANPSQWIAADDGAEIFRSLNTERREDWTEPGKEEVVAWLAENYPNWKDATAYWDEPVDASRLSQPASADEPAPKTENPNV